MSEIIDQGPAPIVTNIEKITEDNTNFRTTLWTGKNLQITLMSIEVGEEIGREVHEDHDQFLRLEQGKASVYMESKDGQMQTWEAEDGDAIVVPAGTWHNLVNSGDVALRLYSIYAPPQHPHGTVHVTKLEADEAEANEHNQ